MGRYRTPLGWFIPLVTALVIGAAAGLTNTKNPIDGLHHDLTLAQNNLLVRSKNNAFASHVAVVALDDKSLKRLASYPRIFLAPKWAELVNALHEANAAAIGFDFIFAYPDEHFPNGWESGFLKVLGENADRIVLARSAATMPARRFQAVFGFADPSTYLGLVELEADSDGVVRTMPANLPYFNADGTIRTAPTFANILLHKAGYRMPVGGVRLAPGQRVDATIPAYSLSDVLDCAESGHAGEIADRFSGTIVLIGSTQKGEDEGRTVDRFFVRPSSQAYSRDMESGGGACNLTALQDWRNGTLVPNVYLHAAAIESAASGVLPKTTRTPVRIGVSVSACLAAALSVIFLDLASAVGCFVVLAALLHAATSALFLINIWLPVGIAIPAMLAAGLATYAWQYSFVEGQRQHIHRLFNYFISDRLVDQMIKCNEMPKLGGERREITVMFADLVGYTAQSDRLAPHDLMTITNEYLGIISDCVEETGGYVDKFIGDEVMAFWGGAVSDTDHALNAVSSGLAILSRIDMRRKADDLDGKPSFQVRIAINSGEAIVGNVGSSKRLNFSAVGRTVTITSRLETYASDNRIEFILGEEAAARIGDAYDIEKIGDLILKGFSRPIAAYAITRSPIASAAPLT